MKKLLILTCIGLIGSVEAAYTTITNATSHPLKAAITLGGPKKYCRIAPIIIPSGGRQEMGKAGCCPTRAIFTKADGTAQLKTELPKRSFFGKCKKSSVAVTEKPDGTLNAAVTY